MERRHLNLDLDLDLDLNLTRQRRADYGERLRKAQLREGFSYLDDEAFVTRPYWPLEPKNKMQPHIWKWKEVRHLVREAGDMIGLGRGQDHYDRRVLALINPGANGDFTLSGTLFGDIQLIRAGEAAPCHRHTPCAARFILEGSHGWTTVAGHKTHVRSGDVVFTGQFPWHDHGNGGPEDFIFLDVLDIPLLYFTGTSAWEFDYERITGGSENVHQPVTAVGERHNSPDLAHWQWTDVRQTLLEKAQVKDSGCAYDGLRIEFAQREGGPIGPTMSIYAQMLRAGEKTLRHRHTSSTIYVAIEGQGFVSIDEDVYEFEPGDIFVIPSWHWHGFENSSMEPCFLQSISDASLIAKMRLYREQRELQSPKGPGAVADSGWCPSTEAFRSSKS